MHRSGTAALIVLVLIGGASAAVIVSSPSLQEKVVNGEFAAISGSDITLPGLSDRYCDTAEAVVEAAARGDASAVAAHQYQLDDGDSGDQRIAESAVTVYAEQWQVDPDTVTCRGTRSLRADIDALADDDALDDELDTVEQNLEEHLGEVHGSEVTELRTANITFRATDKTSASVLIIIVEDGYVLDPVSWEAIRQLSRAAQHVNNMFDELE